MEFSTFWFYSQVKRTEHADWKKFCFVLPRARMHWNQLSPKQIAEWDDIFELVKTTVLWKNLMIAYEKRNKSEHLWSEKDKEQYRDDMIIPLKRYIYDFVFYYTSCVCISELRLTKLLPCWP